MTHRTGPTPKLHLTRDKLRTFDHPDLRLMAGELRQDEVICELTAILNRAHVTGLPVTTTFQKVEASTSEAVKLVLSSTERHGASQTFLALIYLRIKGRRPGRPRGRHRLRAARPHRMTPSRSGRESGVTLHGGTGEHEDDDPGPQHAARPTVSPRC